MSVKLCIDCKFHKIDKLHFDKHVCIYNKSLVTGEIIEIECEYERGRAYGCSITGKYWESNE